MQLLVMRSAQMKRAKMEDLFWLRIVITEREIERVYGATMDNDMTARRLVAMAGDRGYVCSHPTAPTPPPTMTQKWNLTTSIFAIG